MDKLIVKPPKKSEVLETKVEELSTTVRKLMIGVIILFFAVAAFGAYVVQDYTKTAKQEKEKAATEAAAKTQQDPFQLVAKYPQVTNKDHIRGNRKAQYLLVEYSDLECPFCKRFHPVAKQFLEDMKGTVAWVYRHFPLDSIHSQARDESIASECVAKIGGEDAFWKFIDTIYEVTPANNGLDMSKLSVYAEESGVSVTDFNSCYDNKETKSIVDEQSKSGEALNVTGTPGNFLINTKTKKAVFVPGAYPVDQLKVAFQKIK
ncbi:MAG: DsbA family protein [Patescibacteria group bacterium]